MKLAFVLLSSMLMGVITESLDFNAELNERWEQYKRRFDKNYETEAEAIKRRGIWEKNIAHIDKHNKEYDEGKNSYRLSENKFTDMTKDEWNNHFGKVPPKKKEDSDDDDDEELDG